jgi:hypothetical protein
LKMKNTFLSVLLIISINCFAADQRAIRPVYLSKPNGQQTQLYQQSHALLVGVSDYRAGWPDLPGVRTDMALVQAALEENGFEVTVVEDPDSQQLRKVFDLFISLYGRDPDNRLLIYFAGHGHSQVQTYGATMGYLVPSDAPDPNDNPNGFLDKAMTLGMIEVYSRKIQSKHALFLFDSCFSGELFSPDRAIPKEISLSTSKPVRQYITSGSAGETVPDQSIFREQFINGLGGDADTDNDGYITGTELGQFLQTTVNNYTNGYQTPQYGKIPDRNLDQGDFVFAVQSDFLRQTVLELEQQVQEAKERLKVANPELREIARYLIDGQRAKAGALLSKYVNQNKRMELVEYFSKQPGAVQYELAQVYRKGLGVEAYPKTAFTWYKEAANRNHAKSQTMLGFLYRNGIGTGADDKLAVNWYRRASEQGEPTALFNLGGMFRKGYGVPQNDGKALEHYRQAAAKGNAQAKQMLQRLSD